MRPISSMGYKPYNLPATQRTGTNLPKPLTEIRQPILRGMDAMLAKEEAELKAFQAKPAGEKALHYAGKGLKATGEVIQNAGEWVKDFATGNLFQLFPEPGVWFRKGPAQNHSRPRIR